MRKAINFFKKVAFYTFMVLICFEASLWIIGYRPFSNLDYKVRSNPKMAFIGHSKLGIAANPGKYKIELNDRIRFQTTHLESQERFVPGANSISNNGEVAFLGCSFTYGYGVNDHESFVALSQKRFTDWSHKNYSIPGYGTVQSYLQLQKLVKNKNIKTVVLCFSSFHFIRNVMSQEYRSNLKIGFRNSNSNVDARMNDSRFPYSKDEGLEIRWKSWEGLYSNYFLREYLASSNWLQNNVDKFKDRKLNSTQITKGIIRNMRLLCEKHKIKFKLVCLDSSPQTEELKKLCSQVDWLNVTFPFDRVDLTNLPHDSHPNAKGHRFIAKKVIPFLSQNLENRE